jgi:hypothetical protein
MRSRLSVWLFLLILGAFPSAAQRGEGPPGGEQFVGTWSGGWEGAGSSGGFELTLEKGKDGALGGKVSVTGEPTYSATFKSLAFDGKKMTAKYDFPPDPAAEVVLTATFEDTRAAGGWSLVEKASGGEVVSGSWSVSKK